MTPRKKPFENIVGKGENAATLAKTEIIILATFILLSANAFNLVTSKILLFGKSMLKTRSV